MPVNIFNTINAGTPNAVARAIANTVVAGANAIKSAITTKGGSVSSEATWEEMANEILKITGEVNVTPLQGIPSDWHDLAQIVAQNTLADFPYIYAILLSKGMESIQLTGSNRYITSDGGLFSGDRMHVFDKSKDNVGADSYAFYTGTNAGITTPVTVTANVVGPVGNIKLTGNGTSINSIIAAWNTANPTKQVTLTSGDGTQIPLSHFNGMVNGMTTAIGIDQNVGGVWGEITLVADGVKTVNTLISEWNAANPTKQITLTVGLGTQIPTNNLVLLTQDLQLHGGVIGNVGKSTRWVIFCNNADNIKPNYPFNSIVNNEGVTISRRFMHLFIKNVYIDNINCDGTYLSKLTFDSAYNLDIVLTTVGQFRNCSLGELIFPDNVSKIQLKVNAIFSGSCINKLSFPKNLVEFSSALGSATMSSNQITSVIFKASNILNTGQSAANSIFSGGLPTYYEYYKPSVSFAKDVATETGFAVRYCVVKLEADWNFTISFWTSVSNYTDFKYPNLIDIITSLIDCRADGATAPTLQTSTANKICYGTNTKFTQVHHVGETFYVNGVAKVIESIQSDTQITMTANGSSTANGLSYGANKVLTVGATNLAKLTAGEIAVGTNKGWTLN